MTDISSSSRASACANCESCQRPLAEHGAPHEWDVQRLPSCPPPSLTGTYRAPTASAPPRTEAPETRRSAYAFPIHACERCWHGESELTIHNKVLTACPKCGGTMREVGVPVTEAPQPCDLLCLVCARVKPWGIWDQTSGIAVCVECRDKARTPSPSAEAPETRRVQQEDPMGCGVACLAMVSGRTYAEVRADINPAQVEHGLADQTILWWLNRNGVWHRRSWMDGEWSYPVPMSGVALMLTHDAHWVVLVDGVVLDPARPEPLPSYDFRQAIEVRPERAPVLAVDHSRSSPNEVNADAT